ncbi:hypothetical protein LCGC14_0226420 [marine sediment metagenome]|uniref:Uncharacterized protein n=1 Tax=marine sediment metagenome TaxID=412755 RepID=A0A0F9UG98_9ZZZZ|nr:hypothetical protein [Phycisphaerae bacterium]
MWRWTAAISVIAVLAVGLAMSEPDEADPARQKVRETYGQRIDEVGKTKDDSDDLALARELLAAASEQGRDALERFALAETAAEVAARPGMPKGIRLAREAIDAAESIRPYPPAAKEQRLMEIAEARLSRLRAERADHFALEPVARRAAEAYVRYARAAARVPPRLSSARLALNEALRLSKEYELTHLADPLAQAERELARAQQRHDRLAAAQAKLATAQGAGDRSAAKVALAEVVMTFDGDIAAAAEYLAGTGDPRERPLADAVSFAAGRDVSPQDLLAAAVALTQWSKTLHDDSRERVGITAIAACQAVVNKAPGTPAAARARVFQTRLEQLIGQTPGDRLREELAKSYGPLHCQVTALGEGRIRAVYDFSDRDQFDDWRIVKGQWDGSKGALVCTGGRGRYKEAEATAKLRFRADRPVRVSFKAGAGRRVAFAMDFYPWGQKRREAFYCSFGSSAAGNGPPEPQGLTARVFGRQWGNVTHRLTSGRVVEMTLILDGRGGFEWLIDGVMVRRHDVDKPTPDRVAGALELRLRTVAASKSAPTGFDDIAIEGVVVPRPDWKPSE